MAVAQLTGVKLNYCVYGAGDPLVLIPGFASGAWSWTWQIDGLASAFRVITFDPRGVSRSVVDEAVPVSIELIADDVAELLDVLAIGSAHILGISFGGFVAQKFALNYPERLRKLILVSTSFGGPNHVAPSIEILTAFASTDGLNSAERIRRYLTTAFQPKFAAAQPETVDRFCELREDNPVPENVYRQQLASAFAFNTEERLKEISADALIITGRSDSVVPMQNSVNLAANISKAKLQVVEDAGHMLFVEKADEFNTIVREFLQG